MASKAEYTKRILQPVWKAMLQGQIERHDEAMLITAVQQLRHKPYRDELKALITWIVNNWASMKDSEQWSDNQEEMVAVALSLLAAWRSTIAAGPLPQMLTVTALCLQFRYQARGISEDLERSVALGEEALQLTPDGPDRAERLSSLEAMLTVRYEHMWMEKDLEQRMALGEEALQLTPMALTGPSVSKTWPRCWASGTSAGGWKRIWSGASR